jgi:hypothetical protein
VSEQAAPSTRKYVILESAGKNEDAVTDPLGPMPGRLGDLWLQVGVVNASTREAAVKAQAEMNPDWSGGTLVAIPEGSWVPTPVRVETKRNVTLG